MKPILFFRVTIALLVMLSIGACNPCLRLARRCSPTVIVKDSVVYKDTIIYKDKEVPIYIPGDTVFVDSLVPFPVKEDISPIRAENAYALAKAWVEQSRLKLQLIQKEQTIRFRIDSAIQIAKHWEYKYYNEKQTVTVRERYIPKIYKIAMFACILGIIFLGVYIYIKIKGSPLKGVVNWFKKKNP